MSNHNVQTVYCFCFTSKKSRFYSWKEINQRLRNLDFIPDECLCGNNCWAIIITLSWLLTRHQRVWAGFLIVCWNRIIKLFSPVKAKAAYVSVVILMSVSKRFFFQNGPFFRNTLPLFRVFFSMVCVMVFP